MAENTNKGIEESAQMFMSFDKNNMLLQRGFLIVTVLFVLSIVGGYYYMNEEIKKAQQRVLVIDGNNTSYIGTMETLSKERRNGVLRRHVEVCQGLFWNVSEDRDNLSKSVNMALEMMDDSGLRLYERYYESQGLANWLYENSGQSFISIEEVEIDMSTYPHKGYMLAVNELQTPAGSSKRHMNLEFEIINYRESYENMAGAKMINVRVVNDRPVEVEENE